MLPAFLLLPLLLMGSPPAPRAPSFTCAQLGRGVTFDAGKGVKGMAKLRGETLTVRLDGRPEQMFPLDSCAPRVAGSRAALTFADLNFDNTPDLLVLSGIGYGGVNVFYAMLFTDPGTRRLRPSQADSVNLAELHVDPLTRTLAYSAKSGPGMALTTLCPQPAGRDYYRCREATLGQNAVNADDWDYTWFAPDGAPVLTRPATPGAASRPEMFKVMLRTFFHTRPGAGRTAAYVIPGDQVEVLELRGDWALVRYTAKSGRVTAGWLRRADLR